MKRLTMLLLTVLLLLSLSACDKANDSSSEAASEQIQEITDPTANATKAIKTFDYKNKGKMSDDDGPAFVAYSKRGYNGASVELDIANSEIHNVLPDGRYVNAYCFLGIDVYEGNYWINCVDVGLCWSGVNGGWHLFYNIYETLNEDTNSWYESSKTLPKNAQYQMKMTIKEDNYAVLTVNSLDGRFKDSVTVEVKGAKKDGSNTSFLFNVALDYPPNTKLDRNGEPCEDWTEITLANSDKGIYFRKLHATNLSLYKKGEIQEWTESENSAVSIWPDKSVQGFDYSPTEVYIYDGSEYYINLDMNRK